MKTKLNYTVRALMLGACLTFSAFTLAQKATMESPVYVTPEMISLDLPGEFESFKLTISGPEDINFTTEFDGRNIPFIEMFDQQGNLLPDGSYTFQLVGSPKIDADTKEAMDLARMSGDRAEVSRLMAEAGINPENSVMYGHFTVSNGFAIVPEQEVIDTFAAQTDGRGNYASPGNPVGGAEAGGTVDLGSDDRDVPTEDQVIADDLIVQFSACIGNDCVNGESFGFDTIKLKENNLRIKFDDTSNSASFPQNDWQITANDSSNGGANKFSIDDITGGRTPFTIEASAPSHSLYVDDGGRVGVGTSTPVVELHVVNGDSPTLRLEQNGSSGFTPQTWDLAGNETNFFVRDVNNGSALPFRIRTGADANSIYIENDNNVGINNTVADATLHVGSAAGDTQVLIKDTNGTFARRQLLNLTNNGDVEIALSKLETTGSDDWTILVRDATQGTANSEILIGRNGIAESLIIQDDGTIIAANEFVEGSDRNRKTNIVPVNAQDVLDTVTDLEISTWNYIGSEGVTHMGPMAQDFRAAFGLGMNDTTIATIDRDGVALAAIKGLNERLEEKDATISELNDRLAALEALVEKLTDEK